MLKTGNSNLKLSILLPHLSHLFQKLNSRMKTTGYFGVLFGASILLGSVLAAPAPGSPGSGFPSKAYEDGVVMKRTPLTSVSEFTKRLEEDPDCCFGSYKDAAPEKRSPNPGPTPIRSVSEFTKRFEEDANCCFGSYKDT